MKPSGLFVPFVLFSILVHHHRVAAQASKVEDDVKSLLGQVRDLLDNSVIPAVQKDLMKLINGLSDLVNTTITKSIGTDLVVSDVQSLLKSLEKIVSMVKGQLRKILTKVQKVLKTLMKTVKDAQATAGV